MKLIMKFAGVSPQQLVRLHDALNGSEVIGNTPVGEYDYDISRAERDWTQVEKPKHAHLLSSKLDPKSGEYSIEIGVNVQMPTVTGYKSALAGAQKWKRADRDVLVSRKVLDAIHAALAIFPADEEVLVVRSPQSYIQTQLAELDETVRQGNIKAFGDHKPVR